MRLLRSELYAESPNDRMPERANPTILSQLAPSQGIGLLESRLEAWGPNIHSLWWGGHRFFVSLMVVVTKVERPLGVSVQSMP